MKTLQEDYAAIEAEIQSDTSPVGIDAKKTHVIIIQKLNSLLERIAAIELALKAQEGQQ